MRSSERSSTFIHDSGLASVPKDDFTATVIGNLGQPVSFWEDEDERRERHEARKRRAQQEETYNDTIELTDHSSTRRLSEMRKSEDVFHIAPSAGQSRESSSPC